MISSQRDWLVNLSNIVTVWGPVTGSSDLHRWTHESLNTYDREFNGCKILAHFRSVDSLACHKSCKKLSCYVMENGNKCMLLLLRGWADGVWEWVSLETWWKGRERWALRVGTCKEWGSTGPGPPSKWVDRIRSNGSWCLLSTWGPAGSLGCWLRLWSNGCGPPRSKLRGNDLPVHGDTNMKVTIKVYAKGMGWWGEVSSTQGVSHGGLQGGDDFGTAS